MAAREGVTRQRSGRSRTKWLTAAFWLVALAFGYRLAGTVTWVEWLLFAAVAAGLTGMWWQRRRRTRLSLVSGIACVLLAAPAVWLSVAVIRAPANLPVDSVGARVVQCGSVVAPVEASELTVSVVRGPPNESYSPVPQTWLETRCAQKLRYRLMSAAGLSVVAALIAVRAVGHFRPPAPLRD
ncbi:hypothetical protein HT102_00625 [Hoyosella sp. G463]|uniref:Uncharacterized protein n=1 Tax=Lolliginicoccus lacisalsi TaxID=2742202 RepID=A0A927JAA0_9ACTN|nr:hypothetical protein [Lolliginicoccus lacisalsi]MBD8504992.1 hypothetical protein [Lolliginicoccus lacisalsi]